jgi:hypothetical protein
MELLDLRHQVSGGAITVLVQFPVPSHSVLFDDLLRKRRHFQRLHQPMEMRQEAHFHLLCHLGRTIFTKSAHIPFRLWRGRCF